MKVNKIVRKAFLFWGFVGITLLFACTDITDVIGTNFIPEDNNMHLSQLDTVTVETFSILKDSIITSSLDNHLLGSIYDPVYGQLTSSIFTKLMFYKGFNEETRNAEFFDSIAFVIAYNGQYFGDTSGSQTIRLYELDEDLKMDTSYYSFQSASYNPLEIASFTYSPKPHAGYFENYDSEENANDTIPVISIKIDKESTHPFVTKVLNLDIDDYLLEEDETGNRPIDVDAFYEDFNGFYLTVDPVGTGSTGSLIGVNLYDASTQLMIYKHDTLHLYDESGNLEVFNVDRSSGFILSSYYGNGLAFNNYNHYDYVDAEPDFQELVLNENKEIGEQRVYLQNLGGTHLRVKFPHIKNLNDLGDNVTINKAELFLSVDENIDTHKFPLPPEITTQVIFNNDSISFLSDLYHGDNHLGGTLDTLDNGDYQYRFRVTRYVQDILNNEIEGQDGIYMFSVNEDREYHRIVFTGSNPDLPVPYSKRARLEVTYTIIDE